MALARATSAWRTSGSIALGAFAVHQLRYLAGYRDGAGAALAAQGHDYLVTLLPLLFVLAASSLLGTVAVALVSRRETASAVPGWAFCTAAVLAIFCVQETAEGLLATGHPAGLAAILDRGGWVAAPIAIAVGRLVSLLLAALASAERALGTARARTAPRAPAKLGCAPRGARKLSTSPLAFGRACRPPPPFAR